MDLGSESTTTVMHVRKRDGSLEPVMIDKIVNRVARCAAGLKNVDSMRVAVKTIGGLYDGASTIELDTLAIHNASLLLFEEPEYSKLAARLLTVLISEEVGMQGIYSFSQSITAAHHFGSVSDSVAEFMSKNIRKINESIKDENSDLFEYFGLRTIYERYLLKNPETRKVIETPQYFFMRIACGLAKNVEEAIEFYNLLSSFDFMSSTPTLFNSGTTNPQMSSCFLLDSPQDSLESIYNKYTDVAKLSKFSGGIGIAYHRVRSRGSTIRGTNGLSNGIIPWLKTLDSSVVAVNQGGKRRGACCVYLETWHADIEEFLELRNSTGDQARRAHQINTSNWIPDIFMKRVEEDGMWSLFDPKIVPHFTDLFGKEFEKAYVEAENKKMYTRQAKARDIYAKMMKSLAETGNGWMTFKDACNNKSNQTGSGDVAHSSNLCTEIIEVSSDSETAVCNLGSINLANHVRAGKFDFEKLAKTTRMAVKYLDRVIDLNYYTIPTAEASNKRWRPIGLGIMGLQDVFFKLHIAFDSQEARELSTKIQEEIYYNAVLESCELAEKYGAHPSFQETKAAKGIFQFELWGLKLDGRWEKLREKMIKGMRNSLLLAIAPTATIASIVGVYESIEPQVSNMFKRETMSGEFMQINQYLVSELKKIDMWTEKVRDKIKLANGSIQNIDGVPEDIKKRFRTVWEITMRSLIDMAADRGPFIDQSQSLNLFIETPTIEKLSSMYMYTWKKGLKTTYYLRSRPATQIAKSTVFTENLLEQVKGSREVIISSSGETNEPQICLACQ